MVSARPRGSREVFRRAAASRLSGQDAGAGRATGSRSRRAARTLNLHRHPAVDAAGPGAAGLRRYRRRISELQPGFRPGNRGGHRSRRPHRQHGLHRRSAGRSVEIHERGHEHRQQRDLDARSPTIRRRSRSARLRFSRETPIPRKSVVLVGTGEADNSADSYFGLGILRSADGGNTWTLISTANSGTYSFSGLGATRMAFSTASGQTSTVVAAMAATSEGVTDGALTSNTYRGLYTSTDAGQTWTYDALFSGASEATSATSVVYNAAAGLFFAAERYHGFYSSPDGLTWTRLANQPGAAGLLSTAACPQNYSTSCPIYRGEITVVPGRNEMYVWFVSLTPPAIPWIKAFGRARTAELRGRRSATAASSTAATSDGCGVQQGFYNLELLAVPNGAYCHRPLRRRDQPL